MRIPEHIIDELRTSVDIVDIISAYVRLQKRGKNYVGLCPFHSEKTPSFTVSPDKRMYYCFGCSKGGNVITFIMEIERLSFVEAVTYIASRVGISIPLEQPAIASRGESHEQLSLLCQFAAQWFHENLVQSSEGKFAFTYCLQRGLREQTIRFFGIGYAPKSWDAFVKHALRAKYTPEQLVNAGLARRREDGTLYDYFRGRLIFPIVSHYGKFVGFGARKLYDDDGIEGKYINSPETNIYSKSQVLYGLFQAKDVIRREDAVFLVEGYMDFLALFQVGIQNVVASSGTALTEQQLQLLSRYTKNLYLVYDADVAGSSATLRGIDLALEKNFSVYVVPLPANEDPDSFIRNYGVKAFNDQVAIAQSWINFKAQQLLEVTSATTPEGKAEAIRSLIHTIAKIPDALRRTLYIKDIAERYHIYESVLYRELEHIVTPRKTIQTQRYLPSKSTHQEHGTIQSYEQIELSTEERDILKVLLEEQSDIIEFVLMNIKPEYIQHPIALEMIELVKNIYSTHHGTIAHYIIETTSNPVIKKLVSELIFTRYTLSEKWGDKNISVPPPYIIARDAVVALHRRYVQRKLDETCSALKQAALTGEPTTQLLQQQQQLLQLKKKIESPTYLKIGS